jgi:ABC-type branched-subunit amino acid transport system ATPase component
MQIHEMPKVTARITVLQDENTCTVLYIEHDWIFFSNNESCASCCMLCLFLKVTQ